jgi:type IV secretory pathway TraG/TraD family ATPase VirD4
MIQLAFALLPVVWRYALIAGMIYVAGHYLGWAVLEAYSRAALNVVQGFGYELGAPMVEISAWVVWVLGLFPASVPIWIRVLCLIAAVSALKSYQVRWALRDLLHPTQKLLKWILWAPYRILRRLTLIRFAPFGKSRWARGRDLKREGMLKPGGLFLGQFRARKRSLFRRYDLYHHGEGHFITIALPGGGKTTAAVIPPLLTATEGSFVVTDPKGRGDSHYTASQGLSGQSFLSQPVPR